MGKRKDRWTAVLEGRYFSALLRLVAEHDLAGGAVHGLDDSEALQLDTLAADEVAALLEALLDGDADALDSGTSLLGQLQQTQQGAAVGQEVVDDENMVLGGEELLGDDDIINFLVGEDAELRITYVDQIPIQASGKFMVCENKWNGRKQA